MFSDVTMLQNLSSLCEKLMLFAIFDSGIGRLPNDLYRNFRYAKS